MQNGLITYWKQNCKTQQNQHAQESTWTCVCHTCHSSGLVPHLCRFGLATNLSGEGGVWCPSDQNQFDGWFQPSDLNLIIFARLTDSSRKPEINPLLDIFPSLRYGAEPSLLPLSHFRARSLSTPLNTPLLASPRLETDSVVIPPLAPSSCSPSTSIWSLSAQKWYILLSSRPLCALFLTPTLAATKSTLTSPITAASAALGMKIHSQSINFLVSCNLISQKYLEITNDTRIEDLVKISCKTNDEITPVNYFVPIQSDHVKGSGAWCCSVKWLRKKIYIWETWTKDLKLQLVFW